MKVTVSLIKADVGSLPGHHRVYKDQLELAKKKLQEAKELKKILEEKGYKAFIIVMDDITPEKLLGYQVDAFVITACPRIVVDDWKNYTKPLLLPEEVLEIV